MNEKSYPKIDIQTVIAFSISIITVFSAIMGWQMGNISGNASSAYADAQRAELNAQKVLSINTLNASENLRSFLAYKRYYDQYQLITKQLNEAEQAEERDDAKIARLQQKQQELRALYTSNLQLFPNKFITREGTYNIDSQLGQMWANAAHEWDLYPAPHTALGKNFDKQVQMIQFALLLLAVSLFFFAIVSTVTSLNRNLFSSFIFLGYAFSISGIVIGLLNWS